MTKTLQERKAEARKDYEAIIREIEKEGK